MGTVHRLAALILVLVAPGCGNDHDACGSGGSQGQAPGAGVAPTGSYEATITMAQPTVEALALSGDSLYVLKAISASDQAGRPLVWLRTQHYALNTVLRWDEQYAAYTSFTPIAPHTPISIGASYAIAPGQVLEVQAQGVGTVSDGSMPGQLAIDNQTTSPFTCGISQPHHVDGDEDASTPVCAFPLYGLHSQVFTPVAKVLLLFATDPIAPGTPVERAFAPGLLIDFSDAAARAVSYDINTGWSADSAVWATPVANQALLAPLLIEPPPSP
ncbi:MAG: hypothetical protein QM820_30270 [Minicystis sp.]